MTLVVANDPTATILIAVDDQVTAFPSAPAESGGEFAGGPAEVIDKLKDVGERVAQVCQSVYEQAKDSMGDLAPDEFTLEFGVTLGGSAGVPFVAKGKAEGTFKVTATWKTAEK